MSASANTFKVDLHIHTCVSKDGGLHPADVIKIAKRRGLDRICITDHNLIEGALAAKKIDPKFVIVGEEILTKNRTEILAFFVREWVPPHLSHEETVNRLADQGAVISVSHPFDPYRNQIWREEWLESLLPQLDAIEGFNARAFQPETNEKAQSFAQTHHLPVTAGSDAHIGWEIGAAYLKMPTFTTSQEFRAGLAQSTFHGKLVPFWTRFFSRLNVLRHKLGLKPKLNQ